jgi:hypothetical protein
MGRRIEFINPFGTEAYDGLIAETLLPCAGAETQVTIRHLRSAAGHRLLLQQASHGDRGLRARDAGGRRRLRRRHRGMLLRSGCARRTRAGGHSRHRAARGLHADGRLFWPQLHDRHGPPQSRALYGGSGAARRRARQLPWRALRRLVGEGHGARSMPSRATPSRCRAACWRRRAPRS